MARKKGAPPAYRRHKGKGQGYVSLGGKQRLLPGPFGSEQSLHAYRALVARWAAHGGTLLEELVQPREQLTVADLAAEFLEHAEIHYRRADGTPTGGARRFARALHPLLEMFRDLPAAEFDGVKLAAVRRWMLEAKREPRPSKRPRPAPDPNAPPPPPRYCRKTVNELVWCIVHVFRWGAAPERKMVPASVVAELQTVRGLQKGRSAAPEGAPRQPVSEADMRATLPHLPRRVAAIVELLWLTAARCGEITQLRGRDVDRTGAVWIFRPPQHKNAWRGNPREIDLGKQAQAVLAPFARLDPDAYWFSPADELNELMAERSAARQTPRWPSHMERNRRKREQSPERVVSERYDTRAIGQAIHRACRRAKVAPWSPHQLRHAALTRIRQEHGLEAAQAVGGHACLPAAEVYTHAAARALARSVAEAMG